MKFSKKHDMISGNESAAIAAKLCRVDYVPNFPITPQTAMIEKISEFVTARKMKCDFDPQDSEHGVMSAAVGASATGVRVFTGTSSQGMLLMHEMMYIASGLRLPIVLTNMSRGISAPITLWSDHNDFLTNRSAGWIMIHAESNQEVLDSIIQAYKIGEDEKVLLPVIVNMDGFVLSFTDESVEIPTQKEVDSFLSKYKPKHAYFDFNKPLTQGTAALEKHYHKFRSEHHLAMNNVFEVGEKVFKDFEKKFKRKYGFIEEYKSKDADYVFVAQGSISTTIKAAINELREKGGKVGLVRLRVIRPWPKKHITKALSKAKAIAVIDQNVAPGEGGMMFTEIKSALFESKNKPVVSSFIMGLGGLPESTKDFKDVYKKLKEDLKKGKSRIEWQDLWEQL